MSLVTSRQHALVKKCRAVARGDDTRMLLDGWHLIADAVAAGIALEVIAVHGPVPDAHRFDVQQAQARGATLTEVSESVLDAMSPVRAPSGAVAVGLRPELPVGNLTNPPPALVVAGFGLQDPGNVGAVVRSADAGGATGLLLDRASADPFGWKALRASMGSAFRLPLLRAADAISVLDSWRDQGLAIVAADPHAGVALHDAEFDGPLVLAFGGEGGGLPAEVLALATRHVRIPMRAGVESLNVAVAAALLVYEAARQRSRA